MLVVGGDAEAADKVEKLLAAGARVTLAAEQVTPELALRARRAELRWFARGYSESDLRSIDWPAYELNDWDYVLIRTRPDAAPPASPQTLALADHRAGWWLYRNARTAL